MMKKKRVKKFSRETHKHHILDGKNPELDPLQHVKGTHASIGLILILFILAQPAWGCIAYFGYTSNDAASEIGDISASVPVNTAYITVNSPTENIVQDVANIKLTAGPVVLNLENLIFSPGTVSGVNCTHYKNGTSHESVSSYALHPDYTNRLATFLNINSSLFQGSIDVVAIVINSEVNNRCIESWKINSAANTVKQLLQQPGNYLPRIAAGYDFRETIGGSKSKGFPVDGSKNVVKFPYALNSIGYYVYDIFNPNNPSHPNNINVRTWTDISKDLDAALRSYQKTTGTLKAFCNPNDAFEANLGIICPNVSVWKLGVLAKNWRNYWLSDPRNEMVLAFHWPSFQGGAGQTISGSSVLPSVQVEHNNFLPALNCQMTFPTF